MAVVVSIAVFYPRGSRVTKADDKRAWLAIAAATNVVIDDSSLGFHRNQHVNKSGLPTQGES